MGNPFQLTFTLNQHTPIIHFQHDQDGATLRASELKPKLDKYIIRQKGGWQNIPVEWRMGKHEAQHEALDYKVKVEAVSTPKYYVISSNPPSNRFDNGRRQKAQQLGAEYVNQTQYFADNEYIDKDVAQWKNIRKGILYPQARLLFSFSNLSLKAEVNKHLNDFFCLHNFGTRQTKGFGCFLPDSIRDADLLNALKNTKHRNITGVFKVTNNNDAISKLQWIAKNYSLLKKGQGAREPGGYKKAKIWEALCDGKSSSWEKRKIKTHILSHDKSLFASLAYDNNHGKMRVSPDEDSDNLDSAIKSHEYVRALLGLAEQFEFLKSNNQGRVKVKVTDTLKNANNEQLKLIGIDRFASPLRFIITDSAIFIVTYAIPALLQEFTNPLTARVEDRKFKFSITGMNRNNSFELTVPKIFDVAKFVEGTKMFGKNLKP